MAADTNTTWSDLWVPIIVIATSSIGWGYVAGVLARRRSWSREACFLTSAAIAFLWPIIIIGVAWYGAFTYQRHDPYDPGDAPIYVLIGSVLVGGVLFLLSLPLALGGAYVARNRGKTPRETPFR